MIAIVSSIGVLHSSGPATAGPFGASYCKKRCQSRKLIHSLVLVLVCTMMPATIARAEDENRKDSSPAVSTVTFLGGAALAFGMHETGHLLFDVVFDAHPYVKKVDFGGVPFFAVTHHPVSPRREFAISSAGFWVQHATDEYLLARHARFRDEGTPFEKGMFAFNVLTSVGYSMAAFAHAGPLERDTRGMAVSSRVDEPVIGVLILAPALLDAYRYFRPEAKWAEWASRGVKVGGVLLVLR